MITQSHGCHPLLGLANQAAQDVARPRKSLVPKEMDIISENSIQSGCDSHSDANRAVEEE